MASLERLWERRDIDLRERTLWRLLYETAARADEVLRLNVEDLDIPAKRARTRSKGGDIDWLFFGSGSARLLPRLKARRATIQIPGKARRIRGPDLLGDVRDDLGRHIGRLRQKRAEKPHRAQLQREPHPIAITTTLGDKTPVEVVKEEEPLQLGAPTKRPYAASRPLRASATTTANRSCDSA